MKKKASEQNHKIPKRDLMFGSKLGQHDIQGEGKHCKTKEERRIFGKSKYIRGAETNKEDRCLMEENT